MSLIEQIDKQIDVHVKFMNSMEQIRWHFTSAFGITALVGLLFLGAKLGESLTREETLVAYAIVAVVAIAGLLTQVRIIGLFWSEWQRIRILQNEKLTLLESQDIVVSEPIRKVWSLPHIVPPESINKLYFTVHEANCLLFAMLFSAAIGMMIHHIIQKPLVLLAIVVAGSVIITYIGHKIGMYYCKKVLTHG